MHRLSSHLLACFTVILGANASWLGAEEQQNSGFSSFGSPSSRISSFTTAPEANANASTATTPANKFQVPPQPQARYSSDKIFSMPGVVALEDGKWVGADYLGYLSHEIGITIEVVKGVRTPDVLSDAELKDVAAKLFEKEGIRPEALITDDEPPLPSLHLLLILYPVAKDRFVIFGSARLFEEVSILRKNFNPSGYWQAITWESQDIMLVESDQLSQQMASMVEKLTARFLSRFLIYNPKAPPKQAHIYPVHQATEAGEYGAPANNVRPVGSDRQMPASGAAVPPGDAPRFQRSTGGSSTGTGVGY